MTMLGEMTLEDAAKEAAGNWQKFESFCWFRERDRRPRQLGDHLHAQQGLRLA